MLQCRSLSCQIQQARTKIHHIETENEVAEIVKF